MYFRLCTYRFRLTRLYTWKFWLHIWLESYHVGNSLILYMDIPTWYDITLYMEILTLLYTWKFSLYLYILILVISCRNFFDFIHGNFDMIWQADITLYMVMLTLLVYSDFSHIMSEFLWLYTWKFRHAMTSLYTCQFSLYV